MREWPQIARDEFYRDQDVFLGNPEGSNDRQGYIKRMVPLWKPKSLLDVACRDGYISRYFMPEVEVHGIDINTEAIEIANLLASQIGGARYRYTIANILKDKWTEDKFDLVMSFEFVEHIKSEDAKMVFSMMHILSKDVCSISTPHIDGKYGTQGDDSGHINCYNEERIKADILEVTGVSPEVECDGDFLYVHWRVK